MFSLAAWARVLGTIGLLIVVQACATRQTHLWPPTPAEKTYAIYVSLDTWHGMIAVPADGDSDPTGKASMSATDRPSPYPEAAELKMPLGYIEWGYAERRWYVDHDHGISGAIRALLWPTAGVIEVARYERLWASRTPQPPADLFVFHLNGAGLLRLQHHLRATRVGDDPIAAVDRSIFYASRPRYHLFNHCHHFIARALREAGLPVSPFWAMGRTLLAMQLRRAKRLAEGAAPEALADSR